MLRANIPVNEEARLKKLYDYAILDTAPESTFDRLTLLASRTFNVPIAAISLIDSNRQWFKSAVGIDASEMPRDVAFCSYPVANGQSLVVADSTHDIRFARNPLVVGAPHVRFYAGVPLRTPDGYIIGTLCIADNQPRNFSSQDLAQLESLAATVIMQIELRSSVLKLKELYTASAPSSVSASQRVA